MAGVVATQHDGVLSLVLNEPETMNALSPAISAGLAEAAHALTNNPEVRCLLVSGAGRAFCAGGDISGMGARPAASTLAHMESFHRWVRLLLAAQKPIVMAVNGPAVGAGFGLAMMGDVVLASEKAVFRCAFVGIGAAPDLGLARTLPRAVGHQRASDILLTNRLVSAQEAYQIGIASRLVAPEALQDEAMAAARSLAAGPGCALGLSKAMIRAGYEGSLDSFLAQEAQAQAIAFATDDFVEGVAAFRERRPPQFRGA